MNNNLYPPTNPFGQSPQFGNKVAPILQPNPPFNMTEFSRDYQITLFGPVPPTHIPSAHPLSRQAIQQIKQIFQQNDTDRDGLIKIFELGRPIGQVFALEGKGAPPAPDTAYFLAKYRFNDQAAVSIREFRRLIKELAGLKQYDKVSIHRVNPKNKQAQGNPFGGNNAFPPQPGNFAQPPNQGNFGFPPNQGNFGQTQNQGTFAFPPNPGNQMTPTPPPNPGNQGTPAPSNPFAFGPQQGNLFQPQQQPPFNPQSPQFGFPGLQGSPGFNFGPGNQNLGVFPPQFAPNFPPNSGPQPPLFQNQQFSSPIFNAGPPIYTPPSQPQTNMFGLQPNQGYPFMQGQQNYADQPAPPMRQGQAPPIPSPQVNLPTPGNDYAPKFDTQPANPSNNKGPGLFGQPAPKFSRQYQLSPYAMQNAYLAFDRHDRARQEYILASELTAVVNEVFMMDNQQAPNPMDVQVFVEKLNLFGRTQITRTEFSKVLCGLVGYPSP